jgi:hypothetical protein
MFGFIHLRLGRSESMVEKPEHDKVVFVSYWKAGFYCDFYLSCCVFGIHRNEISVHPDLKA